MVAGSCVYVLLAIPIFRSLENEESYFLDDILLFVGTGALRAFAATTSGISFHALLVAYLTWVSWLAEWHIYQ